MKLVIVGLAALLVNSVSCDICQNCKVKVNNYGQVFCKSFGHDGEEIDLCLEFLGSQATDVRQLLCEAINVCPKPSHAAVAANAATCKDCEMAAIQFARQLCDKFIESQSDGEYSGKCRSFLEDASLVNFGPVCRDLDQCLQFPEVVLPAKNIVYGINMTKFLENQKEDSEE